MAPPEPIASLYGYSGPNSMPAQEWTFVQKRQVMLSEADKYVSENHYLQSKSVVMFCHKMEIWPEVQSFANSWCDFTNTSVHNPVIICSLYLLKNYLTKLVQALKTRDKKHDKQWCRVAFMQGLLFVAPVVLLDNETAKLPVHLLQWASAKSTTPPVSGAHAAVPVVVY